MKAKSLLMSMIILGGCKPSTTEDTSTVRSLDNFASSAENQNDNSCFGNVGSNPLGQKIKGDGSVPSNLKSVLVRSLSAIPDSIQQHFIDGGGIISVSNATNSVCSSRFSEPSNRNFLTERNRKDISGCVIVDPSSKNLKMMLAPDAKEIAHNVVRMFGFMFGQIYARNGGLSQETAEMSRVKSNLASAFLRDMLSSKAFALQHLQDLLGGVKGLMRINSNYKANASDLLSEVVFSYDGDTPSSAQQNTRAQRFKDFVFAEAFDSFYCDTTSRTNESEMTGLLAKMASASDSDIIGLRKQRQSLLSQTPRNTKSIMKVFFPSSYRIFGDEVVPEINKLVGSSDSGFGLQSTSSILSALFPVAGGAGVNSNKAGGIDWGQLFSFFQQQGMSNAAAATCATNPASSG